MVQMAVPGQARPPSGRLGSSGRHTLELLGNGGSVDGEESFGAPLPGTPNVGFRVSAKPLRFENWGVREDSPLPNLALSLAVISKLSSINSQHKRHKIYIGSGHHCGVMPYSCVVVVDCLLG